MSAVVCYRSVRLKTCPRCKETKSLTEFYRNKRTKDGLQSRCIPCHKAMQPYTEERKRKCREHYQARKETTIRDYKLRRDFGITLTDYQRMYALQRGRCAICATTPEEGKRLFVDHDHSTGKVRGLLCHHCNSLLGYARDDVTNLINSIRYLQRA